MVHILLLILKIIGIVLLVLLGLLLLILLAILFVPVRYRGRIRKTDEGSGQLKAEGMISWMFRFAVLKVMYRQGRTRALFCILGIPVRRFGKARDKKENGQKTGETDDRLRPTEDLTGEKPEKEAGQNPVQTGETGVPGESGNAGTEKPENSWEEPEKDAQEPEKVPKQSEYENDAAEEIPREKTARLPQRLGRTISGFFRFLFHLPRRIFEMWKRIAGIAGNLKKQFYQFRKKIRGWKKFLTSEVFREGMKLLFREILGLLKEIWPRKVKGRITFGFDDPSKTGQALGVISMLYPPALNELKIIPVFEQQIFLADVRLEGRIFGITLVRMFWHLYRDRNIRILYRKFHDSETSEQP